MRGKLILARIPCDRPFELSTVDVLRAKSWGTPDQWAVWGFVLTPNCHCNSDRTFPAPRHAQGKRAGPHPHNHWGWKRPPRWSPTWVPSLFPCNPAAFRVLDAQCSHLQQLINIFVFPHCSSWPNQVLLTASSKRGINNLLIDSLDCSSQNIHKNEVTTRAGQNPAFLPHGKFHCFQLVSLCFEMKTHFCNVCNLRIEITNFTVLPGVKYNSPGHHSAAVTLRLAVITCLLTLCL